MKYYEVFLIDKGSITYGFKWNNRFTAVHWAGLKARGSHWLVVEYEQDDARGGLILPPTVTALSEGLSDGIRAVPVYRFNSISVIGEPASVELVFDEPTNKWFNDI